MNVRVVPICVRCGKGRGGGVPVWPASEVAGGQVARFFMGMELVAPGLVPVDEWQPAPGRGARG